MLKKLIFKISALDRFISIKVQKLTGKRRIDWLMYWLSRLADGYVYLFFTLVLIVINVQLGLDFLSAALIAFSVQVLFYKIIKNSVKRLRPFEKLPMIHFRIAPPDRFSFPSGHTAAAFVMATLISGFFSTFMVPGYVLASLVGFSRIYNGVHYPSDVFAGMLLGYSSGKLGLSIIF